MAKEAAKATPADYQVLIRPIVTEKSSFVGEDGSTVTFEVAKRSTKNEIRNAVQAIYGVEVGKIRTMNYLGKPRRRGAKTGRTRSYKKAYVTLAPGNEIDVVEGV